jgi:hypothetical protein
LLRFATKNYYATGLYLNLTEVALFQDKNLISKFSALKIGGGRQALPHLLGGQRHRLEGQRQALRHKKIIKKMKKQYLKIAIDSFLALFFLLLIVFIPRHVLAGSCTCVGAPKEWSVTSESACRSACSEINAGAGTFTATANKCQCASASTAPFQRDTQDQCNTVCGRTHDGTPTWASADPSGAPAVTPTGPVEFTSPLPAGLASPGKLIGRIIKTVLTIIGAVALFMFVGGGLMWMLSGGSPEKIKKAQAMLVWAVLGLAVIFFSYALVDFILESLGV